MDGALGLIGKLAFSLAKNLVENGDIKVFKVVFNLVNQIIGFNTRTQIVLKYYLL